MILNDVMVLILRYFTEFGSFLGALRNSVRVRCRRKKVHVRYLTSWWVSCQSWCRAWLTIVWRTLCIRCCMSSYVTIFSWSRIVYFSTHTKRTIFRHCCRCYWQKALPTSRAETWYNGAWFLLPLRRSWLYRDVIDPITGRIARTANAAVWSYDFRGQF